MRGLAVFVAYVVVELLVAIWIASLVGWLMVIGLTIAGFVLGILVFSSAGTQAATAMREASATGQAPEGGVASSATRFVAGILIMVPGFVTDIVGLLLLIPPIGKLARRLGVLGFTRWARKQNMSVVTTNIDGTTVTRVVPGDVVVGDVIRREDSPADGAGSNEDSSTKPKTRPAILPDE
ncbi:MAG: FxsA family protein [Candidatus Nanopelagicales bacterium]